MSRFASFPFALLSVASLLAGCLGGSDGVENPKLELQFQPQDGSAAAGRISLYGKSMNPVADSTPLLAKDFPAGAYVSFTPEELDSALKSDMVRKGLAVSGIKDTTLHFNVVAMADDKEAFVGGFSYRRAGQDAGFAKSDGASQTAYGRYRSSFKLPKAVKGFSGRIGAYGIKLGIDYVFIPGSPYHAAIKTDSSFTMTHMSEGSYGVIGANKDSLYETTDTLSTTDTAYSAKAWSIITFIPDH